MILEELVSDIVLWSEQHPEHPLPAVESVIVSLGYTAVTLEGNHVGLAYTMLRDVSKGTCSRTRLAGHYHSKTALELAGLHISSDLRDRGIAVAAINALSIFIIRSDSSIQKTSKDFFEILQHPPGSRLLMIGFIRPLAMGLAKRGYEVVVYDDNPHHGKNDSEAGKGGKKGHNENKGANRENGKEQSDAQSHITLAPTQPSIDGFDILVISGSSLVNQTIDGLLAETKTGQEIILIGPSSGCLPGPLFRRGVHAVGGMEVLEPKEALIAIQEGGGTMTFQPFCQKFIFLNE